MLRRYVSPDEDSARWIGFSFRPGDIVISTRSKSGTTWMQMICAVLAHGTPHLPNTLDELSPWLDSVLVPRNQVLARLAAQRHRRVIKTHTPLDGIPIDSRATYIVVARHPLDVAVSMYHQGENIDRQRLQQLRGSALRNQQARPPLRESLLEWIEADDDPRESMESLPGIMAHLTDAWARRDEPNILLVHYADLLADLDGEMRRVADHLGVRVDEDAWPGLVEAATFDRMKENAAKVAPTRGGVLKDPSAFFRRGRSGAGRELLTDDELALYHERAARLGPDDLLTWLHR